METEGFLTQKVCGVQGPSATPGANAETNSAGLKHSAARQRLQARHYKQSIQKIISTQNHVQPRDLCGTTNNFLLPSTLPMPWNFRTHSRASSGLPQMTSQKLETLLCYCGYLGPQDRIVTFSELRGAQQKSLTNLSSVLPCRIMCC